MNYLEHYNKLINRAKGRQLSDYTEKHHIVPKCMNGTNDKANIVRLTPEEHYLAHQLLVKIYPKHLGLVIAAMRMTSIVGKRNNKLYGWLRKKYQKIAKQRTGNKNGSFGKPWYYDPITKKNSKFIPGTEPKGWIKGRYYDNSKFIKKTTICNDCSGDTGKLLAKWCDKCRGKHYNHQNGAIKKIKLKTEYSKKEKLEALRTHNGNIRHALFSLGLNDSGFHYRAMKKLKELL